jgi:PTH1 family peptidyl-tRNA hydrolase
MRIVVGLGNPGFGYRRTRHNVGFMAVERLSARWSIDLRREGGGIRVGHGTVRDVATILVEPQLFMNRSGEALVGLRELGHVRDLIVLHDDLDLPAGQLRVRHGGGSGGHRGVSSLIERFGSDFDRIRIGIGRPPDGLSPVDYVLAELTPEELSQWEPVVELAADAVECLLAEGLVPAMNRFNGRCLGGPACPEP